MRHECLNGARLERMWSRRKFSFMMATNLERISSHSLHTSS